LANDRTRDVIADWAVKTSGDPAALGAAIRHSPFAIRRECLDQIIISIGCAASYTSSPAAVGTRKRARSLRLF